MKFRCWLRAFQTSLILLLVNLLAPTFVLGAGDPPVQTLTWEKCVDMALRKNTSLQAVEFNYTATEYGIPIAASGFYPTLSLNGVVTDAGTSLPTTPNPILSSGWAPALSWTVFSGFGTLAGLRAAKAQRSRSDAVRMQARMSLLSDLRNAFAQLLFAQKNVTLTERIQRRLDKNASFVQLRYRGGLEARWAYLKAAADFKSAEWDTATAELNRKTQVQQLAQLLSLDADPQLRAEGDFVYKTSAVLPTEKVEEEHPDVLVQKFNRDSFQENIDVQLAGHWPTVTLSAGYNFNAATATSENQTWSVAANVSFPIFSGFLVQASVAQSRSNRDREDAYLVRTKLQTRANLEQAKNNYASALQNTVVKEQQLVAARERVIVVQEEYSAGLKNFLDWDQAQSLLTQAEKDLLSAERDAMIAMAALERAQGKEIKGS